MAAKKGGLGKGLNAIFMENESEDKNSTITLKVSEIEPNREQPRRDFDDKALAELADSIAQHGVLQPLLVRPLLGGGYQIVAGERRWRASRMAGLQEVPVVVRELTDSQTMELALIENLQRQDLSPVEEALGYKDLMSNYGLSQDDVAQSVGKSRPAVTNAIRLLNLPHEVLELISSGKISAGHGRTLLAYKNEEEQLKAAKLVATQDISVRELEKMAKKANKEPAVVEQPAKPARKIAFYSEVEIALTEHLGKKVTVSGGKDNVGTLNIEFYSQEDLQELVKRLDKE